MVQAMASNPDREEINSMLYWWLKVVKVDVPKPKTVLVSIDEELVKNIFLCYMSEGEDRNACSHVKEYLPPYLDLLDECVGMYIGNYPVFVRTDYSSCKYVWVKGKPLYRVESKQELANIYSIICKCHEPLTVRSPFGAPAPKAIAIREWLDIVKWTNRLPKYYGNLEVRVFVRNGKVEKVYPYYHWSGLVEGVVDAEKDRDTLPLLEKEYVENYVSAIISSIKTIKEYAERIANADGIKGYDWSIDFALVDKNGKLEWYFIDMALAEASWRPEKETDEDKLIAEALSLLT